MVSRLYDDNIEQDPRVRGLLDAAAAPTECGPLPGEREALAAFRSVHSRRRNSMSIPLTRVRVAVAAGLGAGVLLAAGAGAAAAGVLPGAAQDTARTVLDRVGVEVPGADEHSAGHADQRGHSTEVGSEDATAPTSGDKSAPRGQGAHEAHGAQGAGDKPAVDKDLPEASEHGQTVPPPRARRMRRAPTRAPRCLLSPPTVALAVVATPTTPRPASPTTTPPLASPMTPVPPGTPAPTRPDPQARPRPPKPATAKVPAPASLSPTAHRRRGSNTRRNQGAQGDLRIAPLLGFYYIGIDHGVVTNLM